MVQTSKLNEEATIFTITSEEVSGAPGAEPGARPAKLPGGPERLAGREARGAEDCPRLSARGSTAVTPSETPARAPPWTSRGARRGRRRRTRPGGSSSSGAAEPDEVPPILEGVELDHEPEVMADVVPRAPELGHRAGRTGTHELMPGLVWPGPFLSERRQLPGPCATPSPRTAALRMSNWTFGTTPCSTCRG